MLCFESTLLEIEYICVLDSVKCRLTSREYIDICEYFVFSIHFSIRRELIKWQPDKAIKLGFIVVIIVVKIEVRRHLYWDMKGWKI
jgi:hypothetical protein